ncbi:hypothetical protein RCH18_001651 [Flavobacterium sp. PL11]|uniref:hypothetical protein n=1 Tax=Flavobacterium sp. PL11 TaxID=3071717 RepID=UPI002DFD7987|nr:hypothetical protein [Flavobacterium sp. PL11]
MKNTYLILSVIFLSFTQIILSQNNEEYSALNKNSGKSLTERNLAINILLAANNSTNNNVKTDLSKNKTGAVIIQQIGNYNQTLLNVQSDLSSVNVNQNGDNNEYNLIKDAKTITASIYQNGINNTINDYSYRTNYNVNTEMLQNGNNQNIKSIGTNSISKDLKVSQSGNGASVIIINNLN